VFTSTCSSHFLTCFYSLFTPVSTCFHLFCRLDMSRCFNLSWYSHQLILIQSSKRKLISKMMCKKHVKARRILMFFLHVSTTFFDLTCFLVSSHFRHVFFPLGFAYYMSRCLKFPVYSHINENWKAKWNTIVQRCKHARLLRCFHFPYESCKLFVLTCFFLFTPPKVLPGSVKNV